MKKALAIFTAYYRRLEGAVGKFVASIGKGEHRTSNTQHSTSNEDGAEPSIPTDPTNASIEDNTLLAPDLSGERNEERGFSSGETTSTEIADAFQSTSSSLPSPPLHRGEGDGFATGAKFPHDSITTTSPRVATEESVSSAQQFNRAAKNENIGEGPRPISDLQSPNSELNFITRDELKRELDSLRRLMESRK